MASKKSTAEADKKPGIVGAVKRTREGWKKPGQSCLTCPNPGWVRAVREALEAMLRGDLPIDTSIPQIRSALRDPESAAELGIEPYTRSYGALRKHVQDCCSDLWEQVEARRAGEKV